MRRQIGNLAFPALARMAILTAALCVVGDAAFALTNGSGGAPPSPTPAPLLGGGLALAGAVVATILVVRRMRQKD